MKEKDIKNHIFCLKIKIYIFKMTHVDLIELIEKEKQKRIQWIKWIYNLYYPY